MKADVSIIIPAFNASKTIKSTISSLINQSYENFEILIYDDASSDNTTEIVEQFSDERIVLFKSNKNNGPGFGRDYLISKSESDWIIFCDADDEWQPNRLKKFISLADNYYFVIFDNLEEVFENSSGKIKRSKLMRDSNAFECARKEKIISACDLIKSERMLIKPMFSRQLLVETGAKHSHHRYGEDSYFLLKLLSTGAKLLYVPEALYKYRVAEGSASSNPKKYDLLIEVLQECLGFYQSGSDVHFALLEKIEDVKYGSKVFKFTQNLKQMNLIAAIQIVRENPSVFPNAVRKAMHHFGLLESKGKPN